jgi:hypothetical protein
VLRRLLTVLLLVALLLVGAGCSVNTGPEVTVDWTTTEAVGGLVIGASVTNRTRKTIAWVDIGYWIVREGTRMEAQGFQVFDLEPGDSQDWSFGTSRYYAVDDVNDFTIEEGTITVHDGPGPQVDVQYSINGICGEYAIQAAVLNRTERALESVRLQWYVVGSDGKQLANPSATIFDLGPQMYKSVDVGSGLTDEDWPDMDFEVRQAPTVTN